MTFSYIDDTKTLNNEDVIELFKKFRNGDLKARENIITHNLKLVLYEVFKKFAFVNYNKEDLISIGFIGLIKAVDTFEIAKNIKFATYAVTVIDNEILMFLRKLKQYINIRSFNDRVVGIYKYDDEIKIEDLLFDEDVNIPLTFECDELISEVRKQVELLSDREQRIIKLYFGFYDNKIYNQYEIAEMEGVTQSCVTRIIKRVLNKIKNNLLEQQLIEQKDCIDIKPKKQISIQDILSIYEKDDLDKLLSMLSDDEKNIIVQRYIMGKTQLQIADETGVAQGSISRTEKKALIKIMERSSIKK